MPALIALAGQTFGRLRVLSLVGKNRWGNMLWLCRCSCDGKEVVVRSGDLRSGSTQSCGCLQREASSVIGARLAPLGHVANVTHGCARKGQRTPEYRSWRNMFTRCTNPRSGQWHNYGGANPPVLVCQRWLRFEDFLADLGERPPGTSLGRKGDTGNYEPSNAKWMTPKEQVAEMRVKRQKKAS
jgi:hypothetical protein